MKNTDRDFLCSRTKDQSPNNTNPAAVFPPTAQMGSGDRDGDRIPVGVSLGW